MMYDVQIDVCADFLKGGSTEDRETATALLQGGYLQKREDGSIFTAIPAFTYEQKRSFDEITEDCLGPLMPDYAKALEGFLAGYKKLFPPHLQEQRERFCAGMFASLYTAIVESAIRRELLTPPSKGSVCDVLVQYRKS